MGRIDVFVDNAGGSPLYSSLAEISGEYFDKTIALNMKGPFRLCALVGKQMCEQPDGGSIIIVSSNASQTPSMNAAVCECFSCPASCPVARELRV
jgi:NAD(P)-dependent dehydrogenase (short-subunit alcohol dehydrogenase family)